MDFPHSLDLIVTKDCVFRCPICHGAGSAPGPTTPGSRETRQAVAEALRCCTQQVCLGGGEPTLAGDFLDIVRILKRPGPDRPAGLTTWLMTNGVTLARGDQSPWLSLIDRLSLSLNGPQEGTDACTRSPGAFQATLGALRLLLRLKRRPELQVTCVVSMANQDCLAAIADLLLAESSTARTSPPTLKLNRYVPLDSGDDRKVLELFLTAQEFKARCRGLLRTHRDRLPIRWSVSGERELAYLFCSLEDGTLHTVAEGRYLYLGDIRRPGTWARRPLTIVARNLAKRCRLRDQKED